MSLTILLERLICRRCGNCHQTEVEAIPIAGKYVGLLTFRSLRAAASDLGDVFGPKASDDRMNESQDVVKKIDDHFERGIAAFQ